MNKFVCNDNTVPREIDNTWSLLDMAFPGELWGESNIVAEKELKQSSNVKKGFGRLMSADSDLKSDMQRTFETGSQVGHTQKTISQNTLEDINQLPQSELKSQTYQPLLNDDRCPLSIASKQLSYGTNQQYVPFSCFCKTFTRQAKVSDMIHFLEYPYLNSPMIKPSSTGIYDEGIKTIGYFGLEVCENRDALSYTYPEDTYCTNHPVLTHSVSQRINDKHYAPIRDKNILRRKEIDPFQCSSLVHLPLECTESHESGASMEAENGPIFIENNVQKLNDWTNLFVTWSGIGTGLAYKLTRHGFKIKSFLGTSDANVYNVEFVNHTIAMMAFVKQKELCLRMVFPTEQ